MYLDIRSLHADYLHFCVVMFILRIKKLQKKFFRKWFTQYTFFTVLPIMELTGICRKCKEINIIEQYFTKLKVNNKKLYVPSIIGNIS